MNIYIKAKLGIKTVTVRQQVSRGMWSLVMVGEGGKEVMTIGWGYGGGWSGWFSILVARIFIRGYSLKYTNFLSLKDAWSVIVSAVIPVYASGKQGNIKTMSFLTILSHLLGLCRSLNWLKDCSRENNIWWEL